MPVTVLLTSASQKAPLITALKKAATRLDVSAVVVAGDTDSQAPARYLADDFWPMPPTDDDNIEDLIAGCVARGIQIVLPSRDGELLFWSRHCRRFAEAGVTVLISLPDKISGCLDKLEFANRAASLGVPVIPAALTPDRFGKSRLVVKERYGAGSKGIGLDLDHTSALSHADLLANPIFQPYIVGPEISIDAWLTKRGDVHGLVLRRRDRLLHGESQVTTTFRSQELETAAASALSVLGLSGPVVMQALVTPDGLAIIETNPRFGGASTASIAVGLDLLYWSIFEATVAGSVPPPFERSSWEVRQVRVPSDIMLYDPDF